MIGGRENCGGWFGEKGIWTDTYYKAISVPKIVFQGCIIIEILRLFYKIISAENQVANLKNIGSKLQTSTIARA